MIPNLTLTYYLEVYMAYIYILRVYLTFFLAYTLTFCLTAFLTYFLASILTFLLPFFLPFYLASILRFLLAFLLASVRSSRYGLGPGVDKERTSKE